MRPVPAASTVLVAALAALALSSLVAPAAPAHAQVVTVARQDDNGNVLVPSSGAPQSLTCGNGKTYHNTVMLPAGDPLVWHQFGRPPASGLGGPYTPGPATIDLSPAGGSLPLRDMDAVVVLEVQQTVTYSIYQLRTTAVPSQLPAPLASGTLTFAGARGSFATATINVDLAPLAGDVLHVRAVTSDGSTSVASHGDEHYWLFNARVAAVPYGHLEGAGHVQTVQNHAMTAAPAQDVAARTGDVAVMSPSGVGGVGQRINEISPTVLRMGLGASDLPRSSAAAVDLDALVHYSLYTPVYDVDGATLPSIGRAFFVPRYDLTAVASPLVCTRADLVWSPTHTQAGGRVADTSVGALAPSTTGTTRISLAVTAPASTSLKPTASLFTGRVDTSFTPVVLPGTDGKLVVMRDIYTPLFPQGPSGPPPSENFLDANGFAGIARHGPFFDSVDGKNKYFETYLVQVNKTFVDSEPPDGFCSMTPDLSGFPHGPPLYQDNPTYSQGSTWATEFYKPGAMRVVDRDISTYEGRYDLRCTVVKADGTPVSTHKIVTLGDWTESPTGLTSFVSAYESNQFGWGGDTNFLGLGIVGVMCLMSAMVGFNRKHLPASAVIFITLIGAFGYFGLLNVTETVMGALVMLAILMVFQRQGGRP